MCARHARSPTPQEQARAALQARGAHARPPLHGPAASPYVCRCAAGRRTRLSNSSQAGWTWDPAGVALHGSCGRPMRAARAAGSCARRAASCTGLRNGSQARRGAPGPLSCSGAVVMPLGKHNAGSGAAPRALPLDQGSMHTTGVMVKAGGGMDDDSTRHLRRGAATRHAAQYVLRYTFQPGPHGRLQALQAPAPSFLAGAPCWLIQQLSGQPARGEGRGTAAGARAGLGPGRRPPCRCSGAPRQRGAVQPPSLS
jgi:hypothetical protein